MQYKLGEPKELSYAFNTADPKCFQTIYELCTRKKW